MALTAYSGGGSLLYSLSEKGGHCVTQLFHFNLQFQSAKDSNNPEQLVGTRT